MSRRPIFTSRSGRTLLVSLVLAVGIATAGCAVSSGDSEFYGRVAPPHGQVLRYVSGSEPETFDPQKSTGQPETRIFMALFDGLVEYHPKTMQPIPAIAERWTINEDATEFVFFLRRDARYSNGEPINAHDFVYAVRRGLDPSLASRGAFLAHDIKYAVAYNSRAAFVRDPSTDRFLLASEVEVNAEAKPSQDSQAPPAQGAKNAEAASRAAVEKAAESSAPDTEFHRFINSPARLVVPGSESAREKAFKANPRLRELVEGKEFVPVAAEDIGVEAVDDYTVRFTLAEPAPYFLGLVPHPFFRAIHRKTIERHGLAWTKPENIVCSGAFVLKSHRPYHEIVVERNPSYWDKESVRLERIIFFPLEQQTTMLNLYKTGEVDATLNHVVPAAWLKGGLRGVKDYMDAPENANEYYLINTTKPPMNDVRVRKAFSLAIDRRALAEYRVVAKPLTAFVPEGIYPGYPSPHSEDFNPERARRLLAEAGYSDAEGRYDPKKFPVDQIEISFNTGESTQQNAEFVQAQWKQNLDLTVRLLNVEWKTFGEMRSKLEYRGFARQGWSGDYMDPYTFLSLFISAGNDNGTGWLDPVYIEMLRDANREPDQQKRYELLAKAEAYFIDQQPVIPLYTPATSWMKKPYVKGLYPNPGTLHAWKFVYIEHDAAKWDRGMPDMTPDQPAD